MPILELLAHSYTCSVVQSAVLLRCSSNKKRPSVRVRTLGTEVVPKSECWDDIDDGTDVQDVC